jgi:AraC-like DNA-binding protein
MIYTYIQPSVHLRDYIKVYKLIHYRFDPHNPAAVKPFAASPNQGITFYPRGFLTAHDPDVGTSTIRPRTVVFGQHVSRLNLCLCQDEFMLFDVSFQPGVLSKFIRCPLGEFVNQNMDAEAVLGAEVRQVNEQLADATQYDQLTAIVEAYLWQRIRRLAIDLHPLEKVSRLVLANADPVSLDRWADAACLSISAFERRFSQQMGVSPKLFARIIRFDRAVQHKEASPDLDWLSIAIRAGYTDYQHLAKDFKQFGGATPVGFARQDADAPERRLGLV